MSKKQAALDAEGGRQLSVRMLRALGWGEVELTDTGKVLSFDVLCLLACCTPAPSWQYSKNLRLSWKLWAFLHFLTQGSSLLWRQIHCKTCRLLVSPALALWGKPQMPQKPINLKIYNSADLVCPRNLHPSLISNSETLSTKQKPYSHPWGFSNLEKFLWYILCLWICPFWSVGGGV